MFGVIAAAGAFFKVNIVMNVHTNLFSHVVSSLQRRQAPFSKSISFTNVNILEMSALYDETCQFSMSFPQHQFLFPLGT